MAANTFIQIIKDNPSLEAAMFKRYLKSNIPAPNKAIEAKEKLETALSEQAIKMIQENPDISENRRNNFLSILGSD